MLLLDGTREIDLSGWEIGGWWVVGGNSVVIQA
jgi:hypothetical protein